MLSWIFLPKGEWDNRIAWEIICKGSEATEEISAQIVGGIKIFDGRTVFADYEYYSDEWLDKSDFLPTALESLHSLIQSFGMEPETTLILRRA